MKFFVASIALIAALTLVSFKLWENNDAGWTSVRQAAFSGELSAISTPGVFWQGFGKVDRYKQATTIAFGHAGEEGSVDAGPIEVQFNDTGTAKVYGNARFEMPGSESKVLEVHTDYRSYEHLVETLLEPWVIEVCVLTAGMFSSEDTYGGNKAEYVRLCEDQLRNGKFLTDVSEEEQEDPVTKEKRRIKRVSIRLDKNGNQMRMESPLAKYEIRATQFLMTENFDYDPQVEEQIKAQRKNFLETNTARAEAVKAAQQGITERAKGEAEQTRVRYEELVKKEQATVEAQRQAEVAKISAEKEKTVAEVEKLKAEIQAKKEAAVAQIQAEQRLQVASLDRKAAEEKALAIERVGQAESTVRRLMLEADNALQPRLDAYVKVQEAYATAIGQYRGALVPSVVMSGGSQGASGSSPNDFLQLLMLKAAKDLSLDFSTTKSEPATK